MDPILKFGVWDYLAPNLEWYYQRKLLLLMGNNTTCTIDRFGNVTYKHQTAGGKLSEQQRGILIKGKQ